MMDDKPRKADDDPVVVFETVLEGELDIIAAAREGGAAAHEGDVYRRARAMDLAALALSGGGIRSATFNLGFLQGMAGRRVLHGFDYLSTVSGGGYVGGWLSALLKRGWNGAAAGEAVLRETAARVVAASPADGMLDGNSGFPLPESTPVRFLRRYANYLTPHLGLSGDTLALISLAVRNVTVMQMLLVSLLVSIYALLMLSGRAGEVFAAWDTPLYWGGGLLLLALWVALRSQRGLRDRGEAGSVKPNAVIFIGVLLPALFAGLLVAVGLELAAKAQVRLEPGPWVLLPMCAYGLAWLSFKSFIGRPGPDGNRNRNRLRAWVGMLGGAAGLGVLSCLAADRKDVWLADLPFGHAVAFGPAILLILASMVVTIHLALAGDAISESSREWWARAGGQGLFLALAWGLASGCLLYAPPLIHYSLEASLAGGGLWATLTWVGARLAQGNDTGDGGGAPWKEILAKLAPWAFLAGLLGLVAWAFAASLPWVNFEGYRLAFMVESYHQSLSKGEVGTVLGIASGAAALFALLAAFIDLNLFSAHSFYRNRLARTFLGASHEDRRPNAFTGFDPDDDLPLAALAGQRPIQLINANLNLTGGEELAWQTRRGASFLFSAAYCGYSSVTSLGRPIGGYRPTADYAGGLSLATAVAVSGAALSPNMGYHTSSPVAALLTAFNMRLARWVPNPVAGQWRKASPNWSAAPLFAELTGNADGHNPWLNVSDGGHFDNLGIYELVRRRAALIVASDVGADPDFNFDDLAMLARKLSVDFGVELEFDAADLDAIRPSDPSGFCRAHWACARIRYPEPGCEPGHLVYVKSSLAVDAPVDIRQYRDTHPEFPHEPTADQWFDEDQFEAYRHLGQAIAERLFDHLLKAAPEESMPAGELVGRLLDGLSVPCRAETDPPAEGEKMDKEICP